MADFPKTKRIIHRLALAVLGKVANTDQEAVNSAIDIELDVPLRLYANLIPDSKLYIKSTLIDSADGGNKTVSSLDNVVPSLVDSWIDFQAQTFSSLAINITFPTSTVGMYRRCVFSLTSNNVLTAAFSVEAASVGALANPGGLFLPDAIQVGWVDLIATHTAGRFKTANSASNLIENADIYRVQAGGGGSSAAGIAQEVAIPNGATTLTVVFPFALPTTNYVPSVQMINLLDANPQFQSPVVTNKTLTGFTVQWNSPTDSGNYLIDYLVPRVQIQQGELLLSNGVDNATITLPITLDNTNYAIIAQLVNYVDPSPQLQTVVVTTKAAGQFIGKWNDPVDSGNYKLAYQIAYFS